MQDGQVAQQVSSASLHKKVHRRDFIDPRPFENDLMFTNDEDLQFIRNPFPDLVRSVQLKPEQGDKLFEDLAVKMSYMLTPNLVRDNKGLKEHRSYTRYADFTPEQDPEDYERTKHIFFSPRGEAYRRINPAELYRVPKTESHLDELRSTKSHLADKFFGPFELQESNLRHLFYEKRDIYQQSYVADGDQSPEYLEWRELVLEAVPRLNHDQVVSLALYLAFEAKHNDIKIWHAVEDAAIAALHHMSIAQQCQLSHSIHQLKPKHTSERLQTLLMKNAMETVDATTDFKDIMLISQGFRKHMTKDLNKKIHSAITQKKNKLFPYDPKNLKQRAENMVNTLFTFASNKKTKFGVYQEYDK